MPQASRQVRKLRRVKRELSLTRREYYIALEQRDQARTVAYQLNEELKKRDKPEETPVVTEASKSE